ncbi:MAG: hypothetical protein HY709_06140 [Candidatus Latescibacteria bacterium]|nr:hypothetical protein [Candidatus Latescibacterota bacterium]
MEHLPTTKTDRIKHPPAFTVKSFTVGAIFSFLLSAGSPYGNMVIRGSWMSLDFSTPGAVFLFFILTFLLNTFLKLIDRLLTFANLSTRLSLNRGELLVVYIMMLIASAIPEMGWSEYLLPIITAPFYFATPENGWAERILPYLPDWLVPINLHDPEHRSIKYFYEGLPQGTSIPWGNWVIPLVAWCSFLLVLGFVMICMMVIIRKQWTEHERLIYPLTQLPQEMVTNDDETTVIPPFFKNPLMWVGFAIPFLIGSNTALRAYFHFWPSIPLSTSFSTFRNTVPITIWLSFPMVGFSYLINLDIAFGLWFFNLLFQVQHGVFNILGIVSTESMAYGAGPKSAILAHEGMGAIMVRVIYGLWVGRSHLKDVFGKAFGTSVGVDDADEILPYRVAVFGMIGGLLFIAVWLWRSGMPGWVVPLFVFGAFVIFVGLVRVVVESGVAEAVATTISPSFVISGVGTPVLGSAGLVSIALTFVWCADIRSYVMASAAGGLKIGETLGRRKRPLFWAMVLAMVIGLAGSIWTIMTLAYRDGGINLNQWFFGAGNLVPFYYIADQMARQESVHGWGWATTGIGALVMGLLMWARHRFLWWPLHPLGFTIGAVWLMDVVWFSIFLAWLLKAIILKYGGARGYHVTRPFFLGLILGQFTCAGFWLIIDRITGMTDNVVFWV